MKKTFRSMLMVGALIAASLSITASAQTFTVLTLGVPGIGPATTNTTPSSAYANGANTKQDIYYSFTSYSTNGTVTIPIQTSPDGNTWAQVPNAYLQTGTTNTISVALNAGPATAGLYTNTYSGMVTIDTSHGQQLRALSLGSSGISSGGGPVAGATTNVVLTVYSPR